MVRPRGSQWQADFSHRGTRYRKDFPTRQEAEDWELEMRRLARNGRAPAKTSGTSSVTLKAAIQAVYDRHWSQQKSSEIAFANAQRVLNIVGDVSLKSITTETVDRIVSAMQKDGSAPGTINRKLAALSKVLHFAAKRGWIDGVPKFDRMREPKGRIRWFTEQEEQAILDWFDTAGFDEMRDITVMLVDSGMRLGELMRLRWDDLEDGVTHVQPGKTDEARAVPQTGRVKVMLARRKLKTPHDQENVFTLGKSMIEKHWNKCRDALGKSDDAEWVPHTCRHTFISRLVQRGVHLRVVQQLAGHRSLLVTHRYAHLCPANLTDAISLLERGDRTNIQVRPVNHDTPSQLAV